MCVTQAAPHAPQVAGNVITCKQQNREPTVMIKTGSFKQMLENLIQSEQHSKLDGPIAHSIP
jgi:hypothetical protein